MKKKLVDLEKRENEIKEKEKNLERAMKEVEAELSRAKEGRCSRAREEWWKIMLSLFRRRNETYEKANR